MIKKDTIYILLGILLLAGTTIAWSLYKNASVANDKWFSFFYPSFHLKLIDQNGDPVENANIEYSSGFNSWIGSNKSYGKAKTTKNGIVELFLDGRSFNFEKMNKDGYQINFYEKIREVSNKSGKRLLTSDLIKFKKNTPLIINVWKINKSPKIFADSTRPMLFEPDGRRYIWDLTSQNKIRILKQNGFGDMSVRFYRNDENYKVVLKAQNGGFIETNDLYLNIAPEKGYHPSVEIKGSIEDSKEEKTFYFTSHNQVVYGWIRLKIRPKFSNPKMRPAISLTYLINLEGKKSLVIKDKQF